MTDEASTQAEVVLIPVDRRLDSVIEGISQTDLWSLWIFPRSQVVDGTVVRTLTEAFSPASLLAWHVSRGGDRSPTIKTRLRAFGAYPRLVAEIRSKLTLEDAHESWYADAAEVSLDYEAVTAFLSRSTVGIDSAFALAPSGDDRYPLHWMPATLPLLALWLARRSVLTTPSLADPLLLSFVTMSVSAGVVPLVLCSDSSMRPAVAAFGPREILGGAARSLDFRMAPEVLWQSVSRDLRPTSAP
jgi:hypothetical protein